jgi:hypothetical protein
MLSRLAVVFVGILFSGMVLAQKPPVYADSAGAIRGYDPVAYFAEGRPVKGLRFASAQNRERFAADPQKYAPQYGGYCAYGVANNYAVSVDPAAWRIVDGKLYLNYSKGVQADWNRDIPGYIGKADANWPGALAR